MSPIRDLFENRLPRPPVLGRIRLGVFAEGRPQSTDVFVFTAENLETLEPLAKRYGGEVESYTPQNSKDPEYRLVSEAEVIDCYFPFPSAGQNWDQNYELWSRSGLRRLCDGFDARVNDIDKETGEVTTSEVACVCKEEGEVKCDATTTLNLLLPETPGVGIWVLKTGSKWATFELHDILAFLSARFDGAMHQIPLRLSYLPKTMRYFDAAKGKQLTTTKRVPSLNIATTMQELLTAITPSPHALAPPTSQLETGPESREEVEPLVPEAAEEPSAVEEPGPVFAYSDDEGFLQAIKDAAKEGQVEQAIEAARRIAKESFDAPTLRQVLPEYRGDLVTMLVDELWES